MATQKKADDGLSDETGRQLLRLLAVSALTGGGARLGVEALRNAGPKYEVPEVPKPLVVDMPYTPRTGPAPPLAAIPLPGKERPARNQLPVKAAYDLPDFVPDRKVLTDLLPTYTPPQGAPDATDPKQVPLFGAGQAVAGVGGLLAGYLGSDHVLRSAERMNARKELEEAKRKYQDAVLGRLADTKLAAKQAAAAEVPAELAPLRAVLDRLYDAVVVKRAEAPDTVSGAAARTGLSALFPGLVLGPDAARVNMGLAAVAGLGGGYLGYKHVRDQSTADQVRRGIKRIEDANAQGVPRPIVARLVPMTPAA